MTAKAIKNGSAHMHSNSSAIAGQPSTNYIGRLHLKNVRTCCQVSDSSWSTTRTTATSKASQLVQPLCSLTFLDTNATKDCSCSIDIRSADSGDGCTGPLEEVGAAAIAALLPILGPALLDAAMNMHPQLQTAEQLLLREVQHANESFQAT